MRNKILTVAVAFAIIIIGIAYYNEKQNVPTGPIKIGVVAPMTGFASMYGEGLRDVSQIALYDWKIKYPRTTQINFIYEDDKGDTKTAVTAAQKLLSVDHVNALVVLLANSIAVIEPIANKNKIPLLGVGTVSLKVPSRDDYVFSGLESPRIRGHVSADYLIDKLGNPKIAIISNLENDLGIAWLTGFKERYAERGVTNNILAEETSSGFATLDFRTQLLKIKKVNPDFIVATTVISDTPPLLKQSHELGINAKFFGTADMENPELVKNAGKYAEGLMFDTAAFDPAKPGEEGARVFTLIKQKLNKDGGLLEGLFWDSTVTMLEAIRLGNGSPEGILSGLKKINSLNGVLGQIKFDGDGNMMPRGDVFKIVREGKFVEIGR